MKEIYDIFSKNKEKEERKINAKIIVDYREKNSLVIAEMMHLGLDVEFQTLKVGDYLVNDIAIERKAISDFISSMINKRLFRQLEEIRQYPKSFLIIEGFETQELYNDSNEGVNANAIRGVLLSIILNYKIPIIFTKNEEDTASFIYILGKKQVKKEIALNPKKKSFDSEEQKQFIIEAFPGIGPATAKKLLKEFKTIKNIVNQPLENLEKVIGKKAEIFKLIN
jgi:ERCC4-type nuclease